MTNAITEKHSHCGRGSSLVDSSRFVWRVVGSL